MADKITDYTPKTQDFIDTDLFDISKHVTQTSGSLVAGKRYTILDFNAGDNFTNVANVISGTINTTGCVFDAIGTTPTTYSNGSTLAVYTTQSFTFAELFDKLIGYKSLIWNIKQTGTSAPVFVDTGGANNPLKNTLGEVPTLTRTAAGDYNLIVVAPLFDKSRLNIDYSVTQGAGGVLTLPIISGGAITGYFYFYRSDDYTMKIRSVNAAFALTELSTILTTDVLCMPEIKIFG